MAEAPRTHVGASYLKLALSNLTIDTPRTETSLEIFDVFFYPPHNSFPPTGRTTQTTNLLSRLLSIRRHRAHPALFPRTCSSAFNTRLDQNELIALRDAVVSIRSLVSSHSVKW